MLNSASETAPNHFLCPITKEIMVDPVIAEDGYTYERTEIMRLVRNNKICSPVNRQQMSDKLLPNRALKDTIEEYKKLVETARQAATKQNSSNHTVSPSAQTQPTPIYSHDSILAKLMQELDCEMQEVNTSAAQVLVAMAGLYKPQDGAIIERDIESGNTKLTLQFATAQDHQRFIQHYSMKYPGFLIEQDAYDQAAKQAVIAMDSKMLNEQIKPLLAEHKSGWFGKMMQDLATGLNVPYAEIDLGGDALEKRLVRKAGINTSQAQAQYRGNTDYSTRLHLAFAGNAEYQKFADYYKREYPGFILRQEEYETPLTTLHVSTKLLLETIAPVLRELAV